MDLCKSKESSSHQDDMSEFRILQSSSSSTRSRLGQLLVRGRKTIETPHYVAPTSRGVVPHISHDMLKRHTNVTSVYLGLEDCTCAFLLDSLC